MRRTLTFVFMVIVILTVIPAQASMVSDPGDYLQEKHRTFYRAHSEVGVTLGLPIEWSDYTADCFKYWEEKDVIYAGSTIQLDILIKYGDVLKAQRFRVFASDPSAVLKTTDKEGAKSQKELEFAGLRDEGEYYGRYARINLDTTNYTPGIYFLYIATPKMDKYHLWGEESIKFVIAPPLPEMVEKLKGGSEETLKKWGLESYPTLQEVAGQVDSVYSCFSIYFADGGRMNNVQITGSPEIGRYLGVITAGELVGVVRIDSVEGNVVRSNSDSRFLQKLQGRERDFQLPWMIRVEVYSTKQSRLLTAEEQKNLETHPDSKDPQSPVFGLRNAVLEMGTAPSPVYHLDHPYVKNTSADIWRQYQNWTASKHTYIMAPQEAYVPCAKAREVRCVRLSAGGIPVIKNMVADREEVTYQGLWGGLAYIIGQRVRRPDRINVSASAKAPTKIDIDVSQEQQQQQQQQQDQSVAIDP